MSDELVTVWDTDSPDGVAAFPADCAYYLDYDDGNPIGQVIRDRFPHAVGITITTVPGALNYTARCCDTEASGFSATQAAYWAFEKRRRGLGRPCIYLEVSEKPQVIEALTPYGLEFGRDVDCWIAWWNGVPDVPQGIVESAHGPVGTGVGNIGHQYLNDGNLYDISVALEAWVNGPWPPPVPKGHTMLIKDKDGNVWEEVVTTGAHGLGTYWRGVDADGAAKLVAAGYAIADDADGGLKNRWPDPIPAV